MATLFGIEQYVYGIAAVTSGLVAGLMSAPDAIAFIKRCRVARFEKHEKAFLKTLSIIETFRETQKITGTQAWAFNGQVDFRIKYECRVHNWYRTLLKLQKKNLIDEDGRISRQSVEESFNEIRNQLQHWEHEQEHKISGKKYVFFVVLAFVFAVLNQWPMN
jgi:hypothetical protein